MKKICFKCKKLKDIDDFYVHKEMADGHLNKCKLCTKKDVQERYNDPVGRLKIVAYEKERFKSPKRKKKILEYQRRRRARNKGKNIARQKLNKAVALGLIIKKPCERCGDAKSQAHHTDYRKPLDVSWLCFRHHREEHGQKVS